MPSHKRRKRLPAYFNFSDALLPHVAPIDSERGAGAISGQSGAAVRVAYNDVSPQPTETDRDTCPAEGAHPHTLALLSPGDTVT